MSSSRNVTCRCGTVTLELSGSPFLVTECMCDSCRTAGRILGSLPDAPPLLDAKAATLTVMCTFSTSTPWPRRGMLFYMTAVLVLAATSLSLLLLPSALLAGAPGRIEIAAGIFRFIDRLLMWNPLVSTLWPCLLVQYQPRRR